MLFSPLQDVDSLPVMGQAVSPLKVKRAGNNLSLPTNTQTPVFCHCRTWILHPRMPLMSCHVAVKCTVLFFMNVIFVLEPLQDVDSLPVMGQAVSPLKVKRATKGQGPSWLMATTYLTSGHPGAGPRSAAAVAAAAQRFQPARQLDEVMREQQLADIEVGLGTIWHVWGSEPQCLDCPTCRIRVPA
jgi:hypothetical protein